MVRRRLIAVAVMLAAAPLRAGGLGGDPDCHGRPDDRPDCLVRRAIPARRRDLRSKISTPRAAFSANSVELIVGDDFCDPDQAVGARPQTGQRRRCLRRRAFLLALLDPGLEGLRGGGDPSDCPGLGQREANRRRRPERIPGVRPGRPARGQGRPTTLPSIGRTRRSRSWMTVPPGGRASLTGSDAGCASAACPWLWMRPSPQAKRTTRRWSRRCRRRRRCLLSRRPPSGDGPDLPPGARPGLRSPAGFLQLERDRGFPDDRGAGGSKARSWQPRRTCARAPRRRRSWRDFARRVTSRWASRSTPTPRSRSGPRRCKRRARLISMR